MKIIFESKEEQEHFTHFLQQTSAATHDPNWAYLRKELTKAKTSVRRQKAVKDTKS